MYDHALDLKQAFLRGETGLSASEIKLQRSIELLKQRGKYLTIGWYAPPAKSNIAETFKKARAA